MLGIDSVDNWFAAGEVCAYQTNAQWGKICESHFWLDAQMGQEVNRFLLCGIIWAAD